MLTTRKDPKERKEKEKEHNKLELQIKRKITALETIHYLLDLFCVLKPGKMIMLLETVSKVVHHCMEHGVAFVFEKKLWEEVPQINLQRVCPAQTSVLQK